MIKSVFVGLGLKAEEYGLLNNVGVNHLIVSGELITKEKWDVLKSTGADLSISIVAFDRGGCPLDPEVKVKLKRRIGNALRWNPKVIWLDHFRFDGYWESVKEELSDTHNPCRWCKGKNRSREIGELARWTRLQIPKSVKAGYFAVPYMLRRHAKLVLELGQDHRLVGKSLDMTSPMLYHRMIGKKVSYISEYTKYLYDLTRRPVLPIIQIKDMPDHLADKIKQDEFMEAFVEAKKKPSIGVSIFMWEHAIEKKKIGWVKAVFRD